MRTLAAVDALFPDARGDGLTPAQVADSRARFGANRLTPLPRPPAWRKFLDKFDDAIIQILLAASLLKIVVDLFAASALAGGVALVVGVVVVGVLFLFKRSAWIPTTLFGLAAAMFVASVALGKPSYDGLAVMVAVVLATGVSFLSEYRSDQEFEKLNARKDAVRVKVVRGGSVVSLPLDEVVVGDLIALETGDEIPADGRVVRAGELFLDQSLMTGESEPVRKAVQAEADPADGPEQPGCVFRGTQVVDGLGRMTVTNVGDDTMLGQIARRLGGGDEPDDAGGRVQKKLTISKELTPLQEKLERLAKIISRVGYAAAGLIFIALFARGLYVGELNPGTAGENGPQGWVGVIGRLLDYFVYMVIVIVVAVPEGLPMSVDGFARAGHAEDDPRARPGAATGGDRDHRQRDGDLHRQDGHADDEPDAGGAGGRQCRPHQGERRAEQHRQPGTEGRQASRHRQQHRRRAAPVAGRQRHRLRPGAAESPRLVPRRVQQRTQTDDERG